MSKLVNRESFEATGIANERGTIDGTVEVTIANETKRVRAVKFAGEDETIFAYGITGRYMTGKKAWPGSIHSRKGWNNDHVSFGFDSRSGKHRKVSIHFTKEA